MELTANDIVMIVSKLGMKGLAITFLIMLIAFAVFSLLKYVLECLNRYVIVKWFRKPAKYSRKFMLSSLAIENLIREKMKCIKELLNADAVRVWLYTNGEMSINHISFMYQTPRYEVIGIDIPSVLAQAAKIPITATPKVTNAMFDKDNAGVCFNDTHDPAHDIDCQSDINTIRGFHLKSTALASIHCNGMTAGFLSVSYIHEKKEGGFADKELDSIKICATEIGVMLEQLEMLNKNKTRRDKNCAFMEM